MIYLDANSTSSLHPEVSLLMGELYSSAIWNPSSIHSHGRKSRALLRELRRKFQELLCPNITSKIVFTSGATEACNLMIRGFISSNFNYNHIISSSIEHPAVYENIKYLKSRGCDVTFINPDRSGFVEVKEFICALKPNTELVTMMVANNESGAIQPVFDLASALKEVGYKGVFVCDATQAIAKSDFSVEEAFSAGVDALSVSSHKIGGPVGVGALVINSEKEICRELSPIILGGLQEEGLRAGTENVVGIAGFIRALEISINDLQKKITNLTLLREILFEGLDNRISGIVRVSPEENCLSNTLLLRFVGCRGDDLVVALDLNGVCVSTGSACASGKQGISHVVTAMGYNNQEGGEIIRLSIDWNTTEADIKQAIQIISSTVSQVRSALSSNSEGQVLWK